MSAALFASPAWGLILAHWNRLPRNYVNALFRHYQADLGHYHTVGRACGPAGHWQPAPLHPERPHPLDGLTQHPTLVVGVEKLHVVADHREQLFIFRVRVLEDR